MKDERRKMEKLVLMAQPLLESRTGAYLEWLVNTLLITANKK
jgi:hypothetical protein